MIKRAFVYGDLLFESMLVTNNEVKNIQYHYKRLVESAVIVKFEMPTYFNFEFFEAAIYKQISESNLTDKANCRVRFILYRDSDGFYLPDSNNINFIIETFELPVNWKQESIRIKNLGLFTEQKKAIGPLSNLKTGNALIYVMAKIWAKENNFDEAIILNQNNNIIETASSNIFWVKNNITYTVPLSEGCIAGVSRQVYIDEMKKQNNSIKEKICTLNELQNANKIFISNAANGICEVILKF